MKVQISIDDKLLSKIDAAADANFMSRSGWISLAATQALQVSEASAALTEISKCVKIIAEKNSFDDDVQRRLEDVERLTRILSGQK